jgi:hypothetical protein
MIKADKFESKASTYGVSYHVKKNPSLSDSYQI